MEPLAFKPSEALTIGVELELQILNTRDYNLTPGAPDLLRLVQSGPHPGEIKPEITESMVEVSTSAHRTHEALLKEILEIRNLVAKQAEKLNLRVTGGGSHPFQKWSEQRIFSRPRFNHISDLYGYLAKQFTVFGQHIHVGCPSGDDAIYLSHMMSRYVPHFIALSAASPFSQGEDTAFDSSRLNAVTAFPLSGTLPLVRTWEEFNGYFESMAGFGIVESMKDFYWDVRPKPEYGTIEIRVPDTPLRVERAAALAAYAQTLGRYLLKVRPGTPSEDLYRIYGYNRFLACRFGLESAFINPFTHAQAALKEDILETLTLIAPHAIELGTMAPLEELGRGVASGENDASWLRKKFKEKGSLNDVARLQSDLWMGKENVRELL
jgi:carboxylate-amine ligase